MPEAHDDLAADAELYRIWTQPLPGSHGPTSVDVGAIVWVGRYLHGSCQLHEWREHAEALVPRIQRVLQEYERCDELGARRRAATIAIEAVLAAQDQYDLAAARAEHSEWSRRTAQPPMTGKAAAKAPKVEHISAVSRRVVEAAEQPGDVIVTPFPGLNYLLLGGLRAGELVYLGARPAVGKSSLASEFALAVARKARATLFASLEMKSEAVARRMIAQDGHLDAGALRAGRDVNWDQVARAVARLYDLPIWLTNSASTLEGIAAALDQVEQRVEFLVVDYLQLLEGPKHVRDRRLQVEAISSGLKQMALSRNLVVLALSSLSRPGQTVERKPTLASLRESGALEHDADIVLLLHRERDASETECLVAKNRDGRRGIVTLLFRSEWVGFDERVRDNESGEESDQAEDRRYSS